MNFAGLRCQLAGYVFTSFQTLNAVSLDVESHDHRKLFRQGDRDRQADIPETDYSYLSGHYSILILLCQHTKRGT